MVLDTSAVVAMHLKEPGYERLFKRTERAAKILIGAPTLFESATVLTTRERADARPLLASFLRRVRAGVVLFGEEHYHEATVAFLRFGKGRHPAALNFSDCMSYAVAYLAGMPLLFVGDDFAKTDIAPA